MNGYPDVAIPPGTDRVTTVADPQAYAALAQRVDRDLAFVPVLSPAGRPSIVVAGPETVKPDPHAWQGTVLVTDDEFEPVGLVLARGSGRPMRRATLAEAVRLSMDGPVTLVGAVDGVTSAVLAALPPDARLGLFVARDPATASGLAARTLLYGPTVAAESDDLSFDTLSEDGGPHRLTGLDVTVAGLRAATRNGVAILAGRAHARDCSMDLMDGTICGRSEERALLPVDPVQPERWSKHPTACQQSQMCCKYGLRIRDNLRAAEIPAAFAVLDSCRTAASGDGAVRTDVSIPLTMLARSALAVVCAVGTRGGSSWAAPLLRGLLRAGLPLGTALTEVNQAISADPAGRGRLALFGDAGLVPVPAASPARLATSAEGTVDIPAGAAVTMVDGTGLLPVHPGGPVVVTRADAATSWALTTVCGRSAGSVAPAPASLLVPWRDQFRPWSRRLRELTEIGLRVEGDRLDALDRQAATAVRQRAEAEHLTAAREAAEAYASARDGLVAVQHGAVEQELAVVARSFYHFLGGWPEPWQVRTAADVEECPQCGDATAVRHHVTPAAGTGPRLCYVVCSRCGEVLSGAEEFPATVRVTAPAEVARGERFHLAVDVIAPQDRAVAVTVGAAFRRQDLLLCRLDGISSVELSAGTGHTVELTGDSDRERTIPDLHNVVVLVAVDGAVRCIKRAVWLRAQRC
ncbi:hypothetical protein [Micromonospora sp. WMMD737]|uniref:hypothetical protein n=1 Tax=Micromonospora sp. WMMD737 TaxID=3404113 RepID=UPI003B95BC97